MQLKEKHETYGHSYDGVTGLYLLPVRIYPEADGACPLPDCTVDFPPAMNHGVHQAWRINAQRKAWEVVSDYRGVMLWDKASVQPVANLLGLGELPGQDVTVIPPIAVEPGRPVRNRWDYTLNAWVLEPDYSQRPLWKKASAEPAAPLSAGEALPDSLTTVAPPHHEMGPWRFNDASGGWEKRPDGRGGSSSLTDETA
jgi:hypothetical protein